LNALEKAAIAKGIADYIIDHLPVDEPMSASELASLAIDITEDRGITNAGEFEEISSLAMQYVPSDPRVVVETRRNGAGSELWIKHK